MNRHLGRAISWLVIFLVLVQFVVVVMRYVFGVGSIWLQESLIYLFGFMFTLGAGYTLLHDGHVRVDIFYRDAAPRARAVVDLLGAVLFIFPVCGLIWWLTEPYVASSWAIREGSTETSGIQAVFLLKSAILGFAAVIGLQAVSMALGAVLVLTGVEEKRDAKPEPGPEPGP